MGKERGEKKRKASPGNYRTRLGSWGNLSGTHRSHWWGCGRQDHMERGLWLRSLKLVTRLLPSPWAECEMRLARPNVLHMHHLCHKTNLINVNYVAAIIRRLAASQTRTATCMHILAQAETSMLGSTQAPPDQVNFRNLIVILLQKNPQKTSPNTQEFGITWNAVKTYKRTMCSE